MKTLQGLVIVFKGEPITEELIMAIGMAIKTHCNMSKNDEIDVTALDEAKISMCIANKYIPAITSEKTLIKGTCKTAEDNAIIYIAGLMKDVVGTPNFIPALSKKIADALLTKSKQSSKNLLKALSILDKDYLQVSSNILEETGFTTDTVTRIRKIYHLHIDE